MWTISDELDKIILHYDFLKAGFQHRLFNLTRLAKVVKPLLERSLKKPLSQSAVLMALYRYQRQKFPHPCKNPLDLKTKAPGNFKVVPHLFVCSFIKAPSTAPDLREWKRYISEQNGPLWWDEEKNLVTVVTNASFLEEMSEVIGTKPKSIHTNLTGIVFDSPQSFKARSELLHSLLWNLTLGQGELVHLHASSKQIMLLIPQRHVRLLLD